jgi:fumarate reductase subunit C
VNILEAALLYLVMGICTTVLVRKFKPIKEWQEKPECGFYGDYLCKKATATYILFWYAMFIIIVVYCLWWSIVRVGRFIHFLSGGK